MRKNLINKMSQASPVLLVKNKGHAKEDKYGMSSKMRYALFL